MRIGYDIDGVLLRKDRAILYRPTQEDFIVTGRSWQNAERTYQQLAEIDCRAAVYFNPKISREVTPENAAGWKALMILLLDIEHFYEDDEQQIDWMQPKCPLVTFIHVV